MTPRAHLVLAAAAALHLATPSAAEGPMATRAFAARLARSGHAEARIVQTVLAEGETLRSDRGKVALELPNRLRLDFSASGERVTMRGDGGEWLQPALGQLLVLRPEQAQTAVALWRAFLEGGGRGYEEQRRGPGRYRLVPREAGAGEPDSLAVRLARDGLPARLEAWSGGQRWIFDLSGWRFSRPRGAAAFTLRAPAGYSVFEWP